MLNVRLVRLLQTRYLGFKMFLLARMNLLQFFNRVDQVLDLPGPDRQVRLAFLQDSVGIQGVMPKGGLRFGVTLIKRCIEEFLHRWKGCRQRFFHFSHSGQYRQQTFPFQGLWGLQA